MSRRLIPLIIAATLTAYAGGCKQQIDWNWNWKFWSRPSSAPAPEDAAAQAPHVKGTIGALAHVERAWDMNLAGYGVVIGLGNTGSADVPPVVERYLTEYLLKQKMGSPTAGTADITPARILHDVDSAVVMIGATVPIGAPVGQRFDVTIIAMPSTQTTSLSGGHLMPAELFLAPGGVTAPPTATVPRLGEAVGSAFVNPFADPKSPADASKLREARVIGGGRITKFVPVRLVLRENDYGVANAIQRRINDRFRLSDRLGASNVPSERVANAVSPSVIELQVPEAYRENFFDFIRLVMHLPLAFEGSKLETHARELAAAAKLPTANLEEISLVWEAIGRPARGAVQSLYDSTDPNLSYYAARTGLRLGDFAAADIVCRHATNGNSPLQLAAIAELGRHPDVTSCQPVLKALLDDPNETVCLAAYEALARRRDWTVIDRTELPSGIMLDRVKCKRKGLIYATQTIEQRLAIFGDLAVQTPTFFSMPDELVTIDCQQEGGRLTVYRRIQRTGLDSQPFKVDANVADLVRTMGDEPEKDIDGNIKGMGLSYGQIVSVLHFMTKEHDVDARLVLQPLQETTRMYRNTTATGRPDAPVEEPAPESQPAASAPDTRPGGEP